MQDHANSLLGSGQEVNSSRADTLRREVCSSTELPFLMEAHDGLSAAIAQRAGFKGLWAFGLSIACTLLSQKQSLSPLAPALAFDR